MRVSCVLPLRGGVVAALAAAAFAVPAMAVNYVPQAIAQTGLSNAFGPGLGSDVFDPTVANGGALVSGTPSINFLGQVLFRATTNSTGSVIENAVQYNFTQLQGMYVYTGTSNVNVFQALQPIPAPIYGSGESDVLYVHGSSGPLGTTPPSATNNVFQNGAGILNDHVQYGVKQESTRGNLFNARPDLGLFQSPGAVRDGYRSYNGAAATSDDAPGLSVNGVDVKYSNQTSMMLNQAGNWAYVAQLQANTSASMPAITSTAPDTNTSAVYVNTGGVSQVVSRGSDRLSQLDAGGNVRLGSSGPSASQGMAFNDNGNWVQAWNSMQGTGVVTATNATAPNYANSVIISNRSGSFSRSVDGVTGVGTLSGLDVIMTAGDAAPDSTGAANTWGTGGASFRYRQTGNQVDMNNLNHVAFSASLSNPNTYPVGSGTGMQNATASGTTLFTDAGTGTMHLVADAMAGHAVPTVWNSSGTTSGVAFAGSTWGGTATSTMISQFTLDGGDHITFSNSAAFVGGDVAALETGSPARTTALFQIGPDDKLRMIARTGDLAPGVSSVTPAGNGHVYFSSGVTSGFTANSLGQVAFSATLSSPVAGEIVSSGSGRNNQAMFCTDLDGTLVKILQLGDAWVGADGNTHYILSIGSLNQTGGEDGRARSLSDQGDLTFNISFTDTLGGTTVDGSAVVIAHIPAPGSIALLGLGGLIAARRRRA